MQITLECHYCGSEDVKIQFRALSEKEMNELTIKCKCGKWLVKDGIMGHKHTVEGR